MGMVELRPQESVFFPAPYDENEYTPLIITSQRVLQMEGDKRREMDGGKIGFVGRSSTRPLIFFGLFFLLCGLPVLGYGAYLWISVLGMPTFEEKPPSVEDPGFEDPGKVRIWAIVLAAIGIVLLAIGLLLAKRKRHLVIVRGEKKVMKLKVKDKTAQQQVMMTIQAMMNAAKASAQAAAAAPKPEEKPKEKQKTLAMPAPPPGPPGKR
ncbi:MAG TPA: hypothetical protein VFB13_11290 [Reyranella sp.]|nr:hypothetical protein [Reyranella sp.]